MAGRMAGNSEFWSADGLAAIAKCIKDYLEQQKEVGGDTQDSFAAKVGLTPTLIMDFKKIHHPSSGVVKRKPDGDFFFALSKALPDPTTGEPFDTERLIRIARGHEQLYPVSESDAPHAAARAYIKRGMGHMTVAQFAKLAEISPKRMQEILNGSKPDLEELFHISENLIGSTKKKTLEEMATLYGGYGVANSPDKIDDPKDKGSKRRSKTS